MSAPLIMADVVIIQAAQIHRLASRLVHVRITTNRSQIMELTVSILIYVTYTTVLAGTIPRVRRLKMGRYRARASLGIFHRMVMIRIVKLLMFAL